MMLNTAHDIEFHVHKDMHFHVLNSKLNEHRALLKQVSYVFWAITCRPSLYVYTHTHTHIYIYIYIPVLFVLVYMYIW